MIVQFEVVGLSYAGLKKNASLARRVATVFESEIEDVFHGGSARASSPRRLAAAQVQVHFRQSAKYAGAVRVDATVVPPTTVSVMQAAQLLSSRSRALAQAAVARLLAISGIQDVLNGTLTVSFAGVVQGVDKPPLLLGVVFLGVTGDVAKRSDLSDVLERGFRLHFGDLPHANCSAVKELWQPVVATDLFTGVREVRLRYGFELPEEADTEALLARAADRAVLGRSLQQGAGQFGLSNATFVVSPRSWAKVAQDCSDVVGDDQDVPPAPDSGGGLDAASALVIGLGAGAFGLLLCGGLAVSHICHSRAARAAAVKAADGKAVAEPAVPAPSVVVAVADAQETAAPRERPASLDSGGGGAGSMSEALRPKGQAVGWRSRAGPLPSLTTRLREDEGGVWAQTAESLAGRLEQPPPRSSRPPPLPVRDLPYALPALLPPSPLGKGAVQRTWQKAQPVTAAEVCSRTPHGEMVRSDMESSSVIDVDVETGAAGHVEARGDGTSLTSGGAVSRRSCTRQNPYDFFFVESGSELDAIDEGDFAHLSARRVPACSSTSRPVAAACQQPPAPGEAGDRSGEGSGSGPLGQGLLPTLPACTPQPCCAGGVCVAPAWPESPGRAAASGSAGSSPPRSPAGGSSPGLWSISCDSADARRARSSSPGFLCPADTATAHAAATSGASPCHGGGWRGRPPGNGNGSPGSADSNVARHRVAFPHEQQPGVASVPPHFGLGGSGGDPGGGSAPGPRGDVAAVAAASRPPAGPPPSERQLLRPAHDAQDLLPEVIESGDCRGRCWPQSPATSTLSSPLSSPQVLMSSSQVATAAAASCPPAAPPPAERQLLRPAHHAQDLLPEVIESGDCRGRCFPESPATSTPVSPLSTPEVLLFLSQVRPSSQCVASTRSLSSPQVLSSQCYFSTRSNHQDAQFAPTAATSTVAQPLLDIVGGSDVGEPDCCSMIYRRPSDDSHMSGLAHAAAGATLEAPGEVHARRTPSWPGPAAVPEGAKARPILRGQPLAVCPVEGDVQEASCSYASSERSWPPPPPLLGPGAPAEPAGSRRSSGCGSDGALGGPSLEAVRRGAPTPAAAVPATRVAARRRRSSGAFAAALPATDSPSPPGRPVLALPGSPDSVGRDALPVVVVPSSPAAPCGPPAAGQPPVAARWVRAALGGQLPLRPALAAEAPHEATVDGGLTAPLGRQCFFADPSASAPLAPGAPLRHRRPRGAQTDRQVLRLKGRRRRASAPGGGSPTKLQDRSGGLLIELDEELDEELLAAGVVPGVAQARLEVHSHRLSLVGLDDDDEFSVEELPDALLRFTVAMRGTGRSDGSPSAASLAEQPCLDEEELRDDAPLLRPSAEAVAAEACCSARRCSNAGIYDDDASDFGTGSLSSGALLRDGSCSDELSQRLPHELAGGVDAGFGLGTDLELGGDDAPPAGGGESEPLRILLVFDEGAAADAHAAGSGGARSCGQVVALRDAVPLAAAGRFARGLRAAGSAAGPAIPPLQLPQLRHLPLGLPTSPGDSPAPSPVALTARSRGPTPRLGTALGAAAGGCASPVAGGRRASPRW